MKAYLFDIAKDKTRDELAELYRSKSRAVSQMEGALGALGHSLKVTSPTVYQIYAKRFPCLDAAVAAHRSCLDD